MSSMGFYMQFTVAVLSGFIFHVACHDSRRQCFEVESNTICYFMPNVSSVDWDTAWKTCRDLDATLPVILNEKGQKWFGNYLSTYFPVKPVWTAGRYVGSDREWKWLNGQNLNGTDNPSCPQNAPNCHHETQAVLTKDLKYGARYTHHTRMYAFICSYSGINCKTESQKSIKLKGGCFSLMPNNRQPLHKARNECLKDGGDLATFSEKRDLESLQQLSSVIKDGFANEYWIGLHRKWWIWNVTDVKDIKYNLLDDYGETEKDCLFIAEREKWSRAICSENKNVICQTERISSDEPFAATAIIGIVIAVLSVAIIVVILLIVIRRRLRIAEPTPNTTKTDPSTLPRNAIVQCTDDTYATIDDDDLENLNHKNNPNSCKDRLGNLSIAEPTPNTTKSDPASLSRKTIVQGTDDTYATIDYDDLENLSHKNNPNPCKDRLGNLSIAKSSKPNTTKSDPVTPAHKAIVQSTDDTYATIDLDDDVENLNYQNGPNPTTSYTKVDLCNDPSAVYSDPTDVGASETERSTSVYAEPYINSVVTPVSKTPVASPSDIYAEVNKPRLGKKSDELTSPPIKIGPKGDIYTLPISHN